MGLDIKIIYVTVKYQRYQISLCTNITPKELSQKPIIYNHSAVTQITKLKQVFDFLLFPQTGERTDKLSHKVEYQIKYKNIYIYNIQFKSFGDDLSDSINKIYQLSE